LGRNQHFSNSAGLVSRSRGRRLLFHHLFTSPSSFLLPRVQPDHPVVAVRIDNRAATIAPEHVYDRTLRSSPEFRRFLNDFVDVLDVYIKRGGRGSNAFRTSPSHCRTLGTKHQSCPAQGEFAVHRPTVGTFHDAAFCETKCLLVKADRGRNVRDREGRGHGTVLLTRYLSHVGSQSAAATPYGPIRPCT
jgi:hypothetical protein